MNLLPRDYQSEAVDNVLSIFRYAREQFGLANSPSDVQKIVAHNGCVLIQAPTGAGKTAMAGMIAEAFAQEERIVWFWFTPFKGLVDQAANALAKHFSNLRLRDIQRDRNARDAQSGDVFVTTWASVASSTADKKLRLDDDKVLALDSLIPLLRQSKFKIGVVVDEAHHSFTTATEAVRFYNEVVRPEYTLLITATPDDKDVETFKKATSISEVHRVTVSREDAVDAGLIKKGVKSVAYIAPDDRKALIDFQMAAMTDAKSVNDSIKRQLQASGINLTPLMLVQVASSASDNDVEQARIRLKKLGFREDAIASYTANEPSADLLAVALDETKEVLIFKMAAALGFDAPRAFTLVSMRSAKDTDFGVQLVGRILRVHHRLQGKNLPESLNYGYVFLADAEHQTGLVSAAQKINSIETSFSTVSPYTMVVNVVGRNEVQVIKNGQATLVPMVEDFKAQDTPSPSADHNTGLESQGDTDTTLALDFSMSRGMAPLFDSIVLEQTTPTTPASVRKVAEALSQTGQSPLRYPGLNFQTERMPLSTDGMLSCIATRARIGDREINEARRVFAAVTRREEEIFTRTIHDTTLNVDLSVDQIANRAQKVLFEPDYLDARDLQGVLLDRLKREFDDRGFAYEEDDIEAGLNRILVAFPSLIRQAGRECAATFVELYPTAQLPASVTAERGTKTSRLNVYGVMPGDLNRDEQAFVDLIDSDTSGVVEWWHRNPPRKPWSVALLLPNGAQFFPDFILKIKGRTIGHGILLVEIKGDHILNSSDTLDKVVAEHKAYKRPLMLVRDASGRFMTVRQDANGRNIEDQVFRIDLMTSI